MPTMIRQRRSAIAWGTWTVLGAWLLMGSMLMESAAQAAEPMWVYIGTYTGKDSKGIYRFELDPESGKLTPQGVAAEVVNPSFLALHPNGKFLLAVNEVSKFADSQGGGVSSFKIQKDGSLKLINQQSSVGKGPCHLTVDPTGGNVLAANYGGGSVCVLPIDKSGKLGEASCFIQHEGSSVLPRQRDPHAHSIHVDPTNRYVFAADLGLDQVLSYRFDVKEGKLSANDPAFTKVAPGAGPRHFAFHPSGKFAFVINEINSTITAFDYDSSKGQLTEIQTVPSLPQGFEGNNSTAEVQVSPNGKFLYGSNRGHDSIVVYGIDEKTGQLTYVENESTRGKTPRNFGVDPTGQILIAANQGTNTLSVYRIDQKTGALTPVGEPVECPSPVCVKFYQPKKS